MASSPHPYIANTDEDRRRMLDAVGVASSDELFADIPPEFRIDGLDLPPALSELELTREMADLAHKNVVAANGTASFLGAGAYRHFIPSTVAHVVSRGELMIPQSPRRYPPGYSNSTHRGPESRNRPYRRGMG